MDEAVLSRRIKALRLERDMTLREVAQATGLTEGLISKIENHRVSPPIATLSRIAAALGVKLGYFFREDEAYVGYTIRRANEALSGMRKSRRTGYDYSLLAADKTSRQLEPFLVRLRPGARQQRRLKHSGDEFIYVLRGVLSFLWGRELFQLHEGDSMTYDAAVPHVSGNPDRHHETLLLAVTTESSANHRLSVAAQL